MAPAALMLKGNGPVLPGGSNVVTVPAGSRRGQHQPSRVLRPRRHHGSNFVVTAGLRVDHYDGLVTEDAAGAAGRHRP